MNKYLVYLGIFLVLSGVGKVWHDKASAKALEEARNVVKQNYTHTYVEGLKTALEASNRLLKESNDSKEKLEHEKASDIRKRDTVIAGLQQRATRAEAQALRSNTGTACSSTALTGAELPREDAEFLVREAARADSITKERNFYYEEYERARGALASYQRAVDRFYGATSYTEPVP